MIDAPLVSVIMPAYNAASYVRESLESILNQEYRNLEVLVCDDASTDETPTILKSISDNRVTLFRNDQNLGYLRSINFLVARAKGDFLCFQDADDISHPERIKLQMRKLVDHPRLGFVGTNYAIINKTGRTILKRDVETDPKTLKGLLETSNPFQKPSILFRREVVNVIGMYREEFLKLGNISEDFDWILRASEIFELGNVSGTSPLYYYRAVPTAMTKKFSSVSQLFGQAVALMLYKQRKAGKKDSIEGGNLQAIHDFIGELRKPYDHDESLFYHRRAEALMYAGLRTEAIRQAMRAVFKDPLRVSNYRLLQYCIRKNLFSL